MRHIITGGSGFTGQVLAQKLLDAGQEVINFDIRNFTDTELKKKCQYVYGDIRSTEDIKKINFHYDDVVYHLAARQFAGAVPKRNRTEWFFEVNVAGTQNILQEMQNNDVTKMIFFFN